MTLYDKICVQGTKYTVFLIPLLIERKNKLKRFGRSIGTYLIIFLVVITISGLLRTMTENTNVKEIKFSQFANHLEKGDYKSVNITDRKLTGTKKDDSAEVTYAPSALEIN